MFRHRRSSGSMHFSHVPSKWEQLICLCELWNVMSCRLMRTPLDIRHESAKPKCTAAGRIAFVAHYIFFALFMSLVSPILTVPIPNYSCILLTFHLKFNTRPSYKSFSMDFGNCCTKRSPYTSECNVSMCRTSDVVLFWTQTLSCKTLARTSYNDCWTDNMTNSVDVYLWNYCQC